MSDFFLTDDAVLTLLGGRLAQVRLSRDVTQQQLAAEAGVGKTVVERLENGKSITLANVVRVLRALDLLDELLNVVPESRLRPAELVEREGRRRQRASRARLRESKQAAPFVWGDQPAVPAADDESPASADRLDHPDDPHGTGGTPSRGGSVP